MARYQDVFWSNDYISGINSLLESLEKGQDQSQASLDYFLKYEEIIELKSNKLAAISSSQQKYMDLHPALQLSKKETNFITEYFLGDDLKLTSINDLVLAQLSLTKEQSFDQHEAISKIENDVIIPLKDFIQDYKDFQNQAKRDLNSVYKDYKKSVQQTNSLKSKYENKSRLMEDITITPESEPPLLPEKNNVKELPETPIEDPPMLERQITDIPEDPSFEFPLSLGVVQVSTVDELSEILATMIEEIPIKRRMIPIPGMNNEYFKSEDFSLWVRSVFSKEDTTSKIEKFGQDLINLGLISNWNKLTQNVFVSESGYYYEFTDLARYTSKFDEEKEKQEQQRELDAVLSSSNVPTLTTTSSNVWNGIKNKFSTPKDIGAFKEQLDQIRSAYFQSLNESIDLSFNLESKISLVTKKSESFQKNRISLIHKLHKLFNERLIESEKKYLNQIESLQKSILNYDDQNVDLELLKLIPRNESGWYWPVSEIKFIDYSNRSSAIELFNTDVVNLDIDETNEDLKTKSIPLFLYRILSNLNDEFDISEYWILEIDHSIAQKIKKDILNQIFLLANSNEPSSSKIKTIVDYLFKRYESKDIITFLKYWLLELPDSLLPFTVYDSLIHSYDTNESIESKLHIIESIPRQNLASLLYLLNHLQKIFKSPVEKLSINPGVPFIHLLIRPSVTKYTYLDTIDSFSLQKLLVDLFNKDVQDILHEKLESLEKYHLEKMKRAEISINEYKSHKRQESEISSTPKSKPVLTTDGLKPFKTQTPLGTPITSPRSRSSSGTFNNIKTNLLSPTNLKKVASKNLETKGINSDENEEK